MAGIIVVDRIESDASYASSINIASPIQISNTITGNVNFDSGTLFVDSVNNRVGVGKENPSTKFHVESAGANYITTRDSTSGGIAGLICQNGSDTRGIRINNASLELYDHSAALARVIVDASGRVTMPYQPAFRAYNSTTLTPGDGNVAIFDTVLFGNVGNHYNTATGRFTAPVSGFYVFFSTARPNSLSSAHEYQFEKNGSRDTLQEHIGTATASHQTLSALTYLSAGDYIHVKVVANMRWDGGSYNGFSGYLLG